MQAATIMHVPAFAQTDLSMPVLLEQQQQDPKLLEIMEQLSSGCPPPLPKGIDAFVLRNNILYAKRSSRAGILQARQWVPAIPSMLVKDILANVHDSAMGGHAGVTVAREAIMRHMWWPYMGKDITEYIARCKQCQANSDRTETSAPLLQPHPAPTMPCQRVHVDLFGPLRTPSKKKFILVITDAFTKFTALAIIPNKEADTVARAIFDKWVVYLGVPSKLVSDNGGEFVNQVMHAMCKIMGVKHSVTSPYHAQANSQAETFNKEIANYLKTQLYGESDTSDQWEALLGNMQLHHNMKYHSATKMSPLEMILGFQPLFPMWHIQQMTEHMAPQAPATKERLINFFNRQQLARSTGFRNNQKKRLEYTQYQDRSAKPVRHFEPKQAVWVKNHAPNSRNKKLGPFWLPAVIIEQCAPLAYRLRLTTGKSSKWRIVNITHIKPRADSSLARCDEDAPPMEHKEQPEVETENSNQQAFKQTRTLTKRKALEEEVQAELADDAGLDGPITRARKRALIQVLAVERSEERRVGKECRSRWSPYH
jgi:transposase InsO family protein